VTASRPSSPAAFGVQTFTGPAFYTEAEKYQKVAFEDIAAKKAKFVTKAADGWAAMVQHYFVAVGRPPKASASSSPTRSVPICILPV
jgi:YidC/Oxa1 family membrane protein insertase